MFVIVLDMKVDLGNRRIKIKLGVKWGGFDFGGKFDII